MSLAHLKKEKASSKLTEGQPCMVVSTGLSQSVDQLVQTSEVDNVCFAARDQCVKARIACQHTGFYPHGWCLDKSRETLSRQVISVHLSGQRGTNYCLTECILNSLHSELLKETFFLLSEKQKITLCLILYNTFHQDRKKKNFY